MSAAAMPEYLWLVVAGAFAAFGYGWATGAVPASTPSNKHILIINSLNLYNFDYYRRQRCC
jgi:hypothetical protein